MRTVRESTMLVSGDVIDAASGVGVAQPGNIPFTFTRSSTGIYDVRLPSTMTVLSVTMTPSNGGRCNLIQNKGMGTFQGQITTDSGVLSNGNFSFHAQVRGLT